MYARAVAAATFSSKLDEQSDTKRSHSWSVWPTGCSGMPSNDEATFFPFPFFLIAFVATQAG